MAAKPRRNSRSPEAARWQHLYKGRVWATLRKRTFVRDLAQCQMCRQAVKLHASNGDPYQMHCDHITPHKGDPALFFDPDNLRTLCAQCHNGHAQAEDRGFKRQAIGADGWPVA